MQWNEPRVSIKVSGETAPQPGPGEAVLIGAATRQLAACLEHLHVVGRCIHGDFKPLNAMRMETREWKLIDLDASALIGVESAGSKFCASRAFSSAPLLALCL